jgi:hypothetical protein
MYGEHCLSHQAIHNRIKSFGRGGGGGPFPDHGPVERAVCARFRQQQPQELDAAGFQGLVKRWDKCLNLYAD